MEQVKVFKEERMSKNGLPYEVLIVNYNGYNKVVFLNDAEKIIFRDYPLSKKVG